MSLWCPYRWLPRTFFPNLYWIFYYIFRGVKNWFRWAPVVWFDEDWDWGFLASIMEYKLRRMSKCIGNGCHINAKRDAKQMLICAALLKRMIEDEYDWRKNPYVSIRDQKYLGLMIGKHLMKWWD